MRAVLAIQSANLALAFLLELWALVALGYWGFNTGQNGLSRALLGLLTPLVVAVFWGVFLAPKASVQLSEPSSLVLKLMVFGLAALALYASHQPALAWVFGLVVLVNQALLYWWKQ